MRSIVSHIFALLCVLSILSTAHAQNINSGRYSAHLISEGLSTPWGIEFVDEQHLIVNQKPGTVSLLNIHSGQVSPLVRLNDVDSSGQAGLLDVAWHAPSQTLYFTYSKATQQGTTLALAKAKFDRQQLTQWQDLFIANAYSKTKRHYGSRIEIVGNKLFITIGDRGERDNGQDLNTHAATILRLNLDGSIPVDNPFAKPDNAKAIWSFGHRNPQGLFYDAPTDTLWSVEHGPRGGDEINRILKGNNYGWAVVSHGKEYWGPLAVGEATTKPGMSDPDVVYIPSIAPSNLILYRGKTYPELDGAMLIGALKLRHINVVTKTAQGWQEDTRLLSDLDERIRDITLSPSNQIYFSTDSGKIYRLTYR